MKTPTTSWGLIDGAARGDALAREQFLRAYQPVVRATLHARWRNSSLLQEVDDALQEVWMECFKSSGALDGVKDRAQRGFRAYLYGITQNIARRFEERAASRRPAQGISQFELESPDTTLATLFDREWARALVVEARNLLLVAARARGEEAVRRVELLRLRFFENLPIREIAERWKQDASKLHHQYATARDEFRASLRQAIRLHDAGKESDVEEELTRLLQDLG